MSALEGACGADLSTLRLYYEFGEFLMRDPQRLVSYIQTSDDLRPLLQIFTRKHVDVDGHVLRAFVRSHGFDCIKEFKFLDDEIAAWLLNVDLSAYSVLTKREQLDQTALFHAALQVLKKLVPTMSRGDVWSTVDELIRFADHGILCNEEIAIKVLGLNFSSFKFFCTLGLTISLPVLFAAISGAILQAPNDHVAMHDVRLILCDKPEFLAFFESDALRLYFLERGGHLAVLIALGPERFAALVSDCKETLLLALVGAERISLSDDKGVIGDVSTQLVSLAASSVLISDVGFWKSAFLISPRAVFPHLPFASQVLPSVVCAAIAGCSSKYPPSTIVSMIPGPEFWVYPLSDLSKVLPLAVSALDPCHSSQFGEIFSILQRLCTFLGDVEKWQSIIACAKRMNGPVNSSPEPCLDKHGKFLPDRREDPSLLSPVKVPAVSRCLLFEVLMKPLYRERIVQYLGFACYMAPAPLLASAYFNAKAFVVSFLDRRDEGYRSMLKTFSDLECSSWILNRWRFDRPKKVFFVRPFFFILGFFNLLSSFSYYSYVSISQVDEVTGKYLKVMASFLSPLDGAELVDKSSEIVLCKII